MLSASGPAAGIRFALVAMVFLAVQDGVSKHLAEAYPVPFFVMIRYWFFALFVLALAGRAPGGLRAASRTRMPLVQVFRGLLLAAQILVIVTAFDLIGLAATQSVFALHPLLTTLLAIPILGEAAGWRRLAAVGVGLLGVLVILRPGSAVFVPEALLALLAAAMFSVYHVLTRLVAREDGGSGPAFFYTGIAGAAGLTLLGPFFWTGMTAADLGWLAVLCVVSLCGHYCLIRALDATEAVRIQPLVYLQMVFGIGVGALVFGEAVDWPALLGVAMIIGAGLYVIWREMRARAPG
ncbi:DMT family transporter [Paralimibaculum aggregatum]|uniref:DMT family transporter n=1 Tax=Paralimibaculum aggregatum TaxID=3036245 RepID=A0ABQ6LNQ4_9RHOB|nr:DMT family transporter [Limibaculum sp. NKW23]